MLRIARCLALWLVIGSMACERGGIEGCERTAEAKLLSARSMLSDTNALVRLGASTLECSAHPGVYQPVSMQRDSAGLSIDYRLVGAQLGGGGLVRITPDAKVRILKLYQ